MGLIDTASANLGRARYAAAQSLRAAWYGAHYAAARQRSGGFNRPGEAPFRPERGRPDLVALRKAYLDLFVQDRLNVEEGLYPPPADVQLGDLPRALKSSRAFFKDVPKVDQRRTERNGTEVRGHPGAERYPTYYRQNFHYQSDGWLSDESARIYDTQVETLFTGAADAMRRGALAEISRELRGRDQRHVKLLDVACGTGRFMAQTLRAFPRLDACGLELSPNYASQARHAVRDYARADIIEGQAENMPVEDESVDIVVSVYLFHELPPRVRPQVFAEINRVLKPGGLFVFADSLQFGDNPKLDALLEYFPEGFHEPYYKGYLSADITGEIGAVGFRPERSSNAFLTKIATWRKAS